MSGMEPFNELLNDICAEKLAIIANHEKTKELRLLVFDKKKTLVSIFRNVYEYTDLSGVSIADIALAIEHDKQLDGYYYRLLEDDGKIKMDDVGSMSLENFDKLYEQKITLISYDELMDLLHNSESDSEVISK